MKYIRILSALLLLTLFLSGCSIHRRVAQYSAVHTISKAELLDAKQEDGTASSQDDALAKELPIPLHLLPRELLQKETNEWIEYIPPIGGGVYYLFSYDAGDEIVSYVVMLDIISSTYIGSHTGAIEADGKEISLYGTKQDLRIGVASNCAVKWNKDTDSLTVWAAPPLRPEVKATLQMEKEEYEGDNVGTVLTEWSFSGRVTDPSTQPYTPHPFTNVITEITNWLFADKQISEIGTPGFSTNIITEVTNWVFADKQIDAIEQLSYGIIKDAEHRGEISYWSDYSKQEHTDSEYVLMAARDSFQSNYLYQSYNYDGTALGGVSITHNGQLKNESDYALLSGRFTGTDPQIAEQIQWNINISLSFGK